MAKTGYARINFGINPVFSERDDLETPTMPIPGWTQIEDILGDVGSGTCAAIYVSAMNGNEYVAKGASRSPSVPFVAANELIAARLADRMGIPVLDVRVLRHGSDFFVGTSRMPSGKFHELMDETLFNDCANSDHVYAMVVFDLWICNVDRHEGNLIARCRGNEKKARVWCGWDSHLMLCHDHSHAFLCGANSTSYFAALSTRNDLAEFILLPFVRNGIRDIGLLRAAVELAESVSDAQIEAIVTQTPTQIIPLDDRLDWISFLTSRRDQLRAIVNTNLGLFSGIEGGRL